MKIAIVSESPADEAAIKILVDAIIGYESELLPLRTRPFGWTTIFELLPKIIPALHYGYQDVGALVVVMDSDETPAHQDSHELPNDEHPECRLCRLRRTVRTALGRLRPLPNRRKLNIALGLAVPAMEAWYCAGLDPHVNEVAWARKLLGEDVAYDKRSLKKAVYGSDQPNLKTETVAAVIAARRLASSLDVLERLFPNGFGNLLRDLQAWS